MFVIVGEWRGMEEKKPGSLSMFRQTSSWETNWLE